jgi:hypothetical protein
MTEVFKNSIVKSAFRVTNVIQNYLHAQPERRNRFYNAGLYKVKYKDCSLQYIGQTGHMFQMRLSEIYKQFKTTKIYTDMHSMS